MTETKPKLLPVAVPWQISPSVPNLEIQKSNDEHPISTTFIGHFKCDEAIKRENFLAAIQVISTVPEFKPTSMTTRAPFRMVRVNFVDGYQVRIRPSASDLEVIPENAYDWSAVSSSLLPNETIEQNVERTRSSWLKTEICPDPGMYEVQNSPWLTNEIEKQSAGLRHYIILGHDEYIEVLAKGWAWEPGQPVD